MTIYLVALAYLIPFSFSEISRHKIKPAVGKKIAFIGAFLILWFIAGFRYGLETDYWVYYREFHGQSGRSLEILFSLLIRFVRAFSNNYNVFLIFFAAVSLGLKYRLFIRMDYCFSVLLIYYVRFFVQFDLNAIRQGLAIVLVMYALPCIIRKEIKKYLALIIIASLIHASAICLVVLPFVQFIKLKWRRVLGIIALAVVFRLYLLNMMIGTLTKFLPEIFVSENKLINNLQYILNNDTTNAYSLLPYVRIIIPTVALYALTRKTENETYFKAYLIGAVINLSFFGMDTVSFRLAAYFFSAEMLIMGSLFKTALPRSLARGQLTQRGLRNLIALSIVCICDMWTFFALLSSSETLVPFRCFLFV